MFQRENTLFLGSYDQKWKQVLVRLVAALYIWNIILFAIVAIVEADLQTGIGSIILLLWLVFTEFLYSVTSKSNFWKQNGKILYLVAITILAVVEETVVYANGGGLGGKATSLSEDLLKAVPVFVGIGLGIYITHLLFGLKVADFFILASAMGFFVEILMTGNLLNLFIIGAGIGIYGLMMASVAFPSEKASRSNGRDVVVLIVGLVITVIGMLIGAIVGDTMYNSLS